MRDTCICSEFVVASPVNFIIRDFNMSDSGAKSAYVQQKSAELVAKTKVFRIAFVGRGVIKMRKGKRAQLDGGWSFSMWKLPFLSELLL